MYETFTRYSILGSDSTMDVKICSVMRGIIPLSSSLSMSAPYITVSPINAAFVNATDHHSERFAGTGLTVGEDGPTAQLELSEKPKCPVNTHPVCHSVLSSSSLSSHSPL